MFTSGKCSKFLQNWQKQQRLDLYALEEDDGQVVQGVKSLTHSCVSAVLAYSCVNAALAHRCASVALSHSCLSVDGISVGFLSFSSRPLQ